MLRKLLPHTILIEVLGTFSGCFIGTHLNSIGVFDETVPQLSPFGGTALDILWASQPDGGYDGIGYLMAMDIPFSFVADVAMLPITVPYTLLNPRSIDPRWQTEKLEPTQQAEVLPGIDDDMRQELNNVAEPWNKLPSDAEPSADLFRHEHPEFLFPSAQDSMDRSPPG